MISTNRTLETWADLPGANVFVEASSDNSVTITLRQTRNEEDSIENTEAASLCLTGEQAGILISRLAAENRNLIKIASEKDIKQAERGLVRDVPYVMFYEEDGKPANFAENGLVKTRKAVFMYHATCDRTSHPIGEFVSVNGKEDGVGIAGNVSDETIGELYSSGQEGVYVLALGDGFLPTSFVFLTSRQLDDICTQWTNRGNKTFPWVGRDYPEVRETLHVLLDMTEEHDDEEEKA